MWGRGGLKELAEPIKLFYLEPKQYIAIRACCSDQFIVEVFGMNQYGA